MRKEAILQTRCTVQQRKEIEKKADKAGISVSEYLLKSTLNSKTRISTNSKDMARTITQLQKELNDVEVDLKKLKAGCLNDVEEPLNRLAEAQERLEELWRLLK